jgi:hypothetical protein
MFDPSNFHLDNTSKVFETDIYLVPTYSTFYLAYRSLNNNFSYVRFGQFDLRCIQSKSYTAPI